VGVAWVEGGGLATQGSEGREGEEGGGGERWEGNLHLLSKVRAGVSCERPRARERAQGSAQRHGWQDTRGRAGGDDLCGGVK